MKVCQTLVEPRYVEVLSKSQPNVTYTVIPSTIFCDAICTCPGFQFNGGKCSHITEIDGSACDWAEPKSDLEECPKCGAPTINFDPEPTYELSD